MESSELDCALEKNLEKEKAPKDKAVAEDMRKQALERMGQLPKERRGIITPGLSVSQHGLPV